MDNCIFCKIVKGEIPSVKIWEDEHHVAILDINPNTVGMTLVLTKEHFDSYAFDMPENNYNELMKASKHVSRMLEKGLGVSRVALVMEGLGVNHVHIKLYPLIGVNEKFKEMWASSRIMFDKYEGYISTQLGPQRSSMELAEVAKLIMDRNKKG